MRRLLLTIVCLLLFIIPTSSQINFAKQWDHTYGGIDFETLTVLIQTADEGYLLGGYSRSDFGEDVSELTRGGRDFWIVKTDSLGVKKWDKRFGGDKEDWLFSIDKTSDGGYILGGFTTSDSSGDVSQASKGGQDYWIVKTDSLGVKQWDKRFGGSGIDQLSAVRQTMDGGYLLGGWSFSDSTGDVSQHTRGSEDFWIVKTDPSGIKQWDKRYGGNWNDELFCLELLPDGGYILGGRSSSDSVGDLSQNSRGENDYWLVKIDGSGNKQWDKRYGGNGADNFYSLQKTSDGGYILGGYTRSDLNGEVTEPSRDTATIIINDRGDIWIVKTDSLGVKKWDKRFGGIAVEDGFGYISQTQDGGYLFGSASYSNASGDKTEKISDTNNTGLLKQILPDRKYGIRQFLWMDRMNLLILWKQLTDVM